MVAKRASTRSARSGLTGSQVARAWPLDRAGVVEPATSGMASGINSNVLLLGAAAIALVTGAAIG